MSTPPPWQRAGRMILKHCELFTGLGHPVREQTSAEVDEHCHNETTWLDLYNDQDGSFAIVADIAHWGIDDTL